MATYKLKRYSVDQSALTNNTAYNNLRDMNDAQVLNQEKQSNPYNFGSVVGGAGIGALAGTAAVGIGAGINALKGKPVNPNLVRNLRRGAYIGGAVGLGTMMYKRHEAQKSVDQYNKRLDNAQRHASYRERQDWNNRVLNNQNGYTY